MPKTLLEKLGYTSEKRAKLVLVPKTAKTLFAEIKAKTKGPFDWLLGFAQDIASLQTLSQGLIPHYERGGHLWLCYPKQTGNLETDLNRDSGWESIKELDLLPVTQIAIDSTWSALRFRYRDEIKKLTRKFA